MARNPRNAWPAGMTWVFQGTVAEDATAGTHVSSLTVTPGAGNELLIVSARFVAGAGAANLVTCIIDDGTNILQRMSNGTSLASGNELNWPSNRVDVPAANDTSTMRNAGYPLSGTMRFQISVSTATVSLTHTFAVVCRIKGAVPTATLADTVGTPTLTINTNAVF